MDRFEESDSLKRDQGLGLSGNEYLEKNYEPDRQLRKSLTEKNVAMVPHLLDTVHAHMQNGATSFVDEKGVKIYIAQPCQPPNLDDEESSQDHWVRVHIPADAVAGHPFKTFVFGEPIHVAFGSTFKAGKLTDFLILLICVNSSSYKLFVFISISFLTFNIGDYCDILMPNKR